MLNLPDAKIGEGKSLSCLSNGYPHEADKKWILINIGIFYSIEISLIYEPGGHFCITKEQILLRSREFYKKIVDLLLNDYGPWIIED
jgi:hypothetical protein